MRRKKTGAILLIVGCSSFLTAQPPAAKTLSIGGIGGMPKLTLEASSADRMGTVVMKNAAGAKLQTLTCDLFRDWPDPIANDLETTARVLRVHAETFISGLKAVDVDFDGLPDLMATRDGGGKWVRYCVWLFDPKEGKFLQTALTREMENLDNLTVDSIRRRVLSFAIGPINPTQTEYRIEGQKLVPARACKLETDVTRDEPRTSNVVTYTGGREVTQRRVVFGDCNDVCGDGCRTLPGR